MKSLTERSKTKKEKSDADSETDQGKDTNKNTSGRREDGTIEKYDAVYAVEDGKVQLVCEIPGTGVPEVTLNAALLYAWGLKLNGVEEAPVSEIREICKSTGDFNETNFSRYLKKGHPVNYLDKGTGSARVIKITTKGAKSAKLLADQIQNNGAE